MMMRKLGLALTVLVALLVVACQGQNGGQASNAPNDQNDKGLVLAGSGNAELTDGVGAEAGFSAPMGLCTDGTNVYVADSNNNAIRKIDLIDGKVTTIAGSAATGAADGIGRGAGFRHPCSLTYLDGFLYVADTGNHTIRRIELSSGQVTTVAGSGEMGSVNGMGTSASFQDPNSVTTDKSSIFVADTGNNLIRKIDLKTGLVSTLAGSGGYNSVDGIGIAATFGSPEGVATDGTSVFVADTSNNLIRKIEIRSAAVTTLAGTVASGLKNGNGSEAAFYSPRGLTTDGKNIYVADTYNDQIRVVSTTGAVKSIVAPASADDAQFSANLSAPKSVVLVGNDLIVADTDNNVIRRFTGVR